MPHRTLKVLCSVLIVLAVIATRCDALQPSVRAVRQTRSSLYSSSNKGNSNAAINPFLSLFKVGKSSKSPVKNVEFETVVIPKDYSVATGFGAVAAVEGAIGQNYIAAGVLALIAAFLAIQTGKVRFVFDNEAMEVLIAKDDKADSTDANQMERSRENFAVGGRNRWKYDTFTNWFFIPSKEFPVLMYFKETQTSAGGQVHFFPVIMDGKRLYSTMTERITPLMPKSMPQTTK